MSCSSAIFLLFVSEYGTMYLTSCVDIGRCLVVLVNFVVAIAVAVAVVLIL